VYEMTDMPFFVNREKDFHLAKNQSIKFQHYPTIRHWKKSK